MALVLATAEGELPAWMLGTFFTAAAVFLMGFLVCVAIALTLVQMKVERLKSWAPKFESTDRVPDDLELGVSSLKAASRPISKRQKQKARRLQVPKCFKVFISTGVESDDEADNDDDVFGLGDLAWLMPHRMHDANTSMHFIGGDETPKQTAVGHAGVEPFALSDDAWCALESSPISI